MRSPRLWCTLFPLIYPSHLFIFPATFGLHLLLQTYPYFQVLYVISVHRTKNLLTYSFRFHLVMDTLAVHLYTSSLPKRGRDLPPLNRAMVRKQNANSATQPNLHFVLKPHFKKYFYFLSISSIKSSKSFSEFSSLSVNLLITSGTISRIFVIVS